MKKRKQKNTRVESFKEKKLVATRMLVSVVLILIIFFALIIRIGWIQFVDGAELKERASRQQTIHKLIGPTRGNIYDTNKKALARSAPVDTITINPASFVDKKDPEKTKVTQEKVAKGLSEIFELDYNEVLAKVQSTNIVETIIKKVEKSLSDKLKEWMEENEITSGINIDDDSKRYYPYQTLAAHVIGFVGDDSQGLYGIESKWDSVLKGTDGKIVTTADVNREEISDEAQQYVEVENGSDLYLTLDVNIQSIVEKYLEEGVNNNKATAGSAIVMKPSTGDILAMATYPSYNLNTPFTINKEISNWDELSTADKNKELQNMWKDRNFQDSYEPGSTFKLIIASTALEENITQVNVKNDFSCDGYAEVADRTIKCANSVHHGLQTLKQAVGNSCNSAFIQLGQRIGASTLYKYFRAFGLFEKTGIDITGESGSVFHKLEDVGPVELATTSFGQRFEITPLQLITAVSAIANDGVLMKPRIVKQIENVDTGTVTEIKESAVRQVISKETAEKVRDMMKYVVTDGGGKNGAVAGYSVGGKTGTSEPSPSNPEEGYTVSFVAIAPIDEPEVVVLVAIYHPQTKNPYGSTIAAPIVSNMLTEILPYLGIASDTSEKSGTGIQTIKTEKLPDVTNKTLTEAKKTLENLGFKVINEETEKGNSILVKEQVPAKNTEVLEGSTVVLYTEENSVRTSVEVPKFIR